LTNERFCGDTGVFQMKIGDPLWAGSTNWSTTVKAQKPTSRASDSARPFLQAMLPQSQTVEIKQFSFRNTSLKWR